MTEQQHHADEVTEAAINELKSHQRQLDADGVEVGVSRQALDEVLAARRARPAAPEGEWVVKPLEWWVSDTGDRIADTIVGRYQIQNVTANSGVRLFAPLREIKPNNEIEYWQESDAKAAAQADYEQRIRSALSAAPKPEPASAVQVTEEMMDRAIAEFSRWDEGSVSRAGKPTEYTVFRADDSGEMQRVSSHTSREDMALALAAFRMSAVLAAALSLSVLEPAPQPDAKASGVEDDTFEFKGKTFYKGPIVTDDFGTYRRISSTAPTEAGVEEPEVVAIRGIDGQVLLDIAQRGEDDEYQNSPAWLWFGEDGTSFGRWNKGEQVAYIRGDLDADALTTERERTAKLQEVLKEAEAELVKLYGAIAPASEGRMADQSDAVKSIRAALRELKGGK